MTHAYKQTDVGMIPADWEVVSFDSIGVVIDGDRGNNYPSDDDFKPNGHCLFLNAGNVTKTGFRFASNSFITLEKDNRLGKGKLKRDDIILTTRGTVGNIAYFNSNVPYSNLRINSGMVILRQESPKFIPVYLYTLLQSHVIGIQIDRLSFGSAQPQLTVKQIEKLIIPLPPLPEQRAIATALSDVDALIGALEALIAKKRAIKQATMQQLLTGQTRLPGFSGAWEVLNMAHNSILKARIGWQGLTTEEYLDDGKYYLVTGTDFLDGRIKWSSCHFVAEERYSQDRNIQLRTRDILLTKDGTIGKVAYVEHLPGLATLNSGVFVIRPKAESYDPHFFYFLLTSRIFEEFLNKLAAGSTISHLYQKDFATFSFFAPPTLAEQTAIATVLSDMDAELAALDVQLHKTRTIKQGMMQELLTGRTRLPVSPTQEEAHAE